MLSSLTLIALLATGLAADNGLMSVHGSKRVTRLRHSQPTDGQISFEQGDLVHLFAPDQARSQRHYVDDSDHPRKHGSRNLQSTNFDRACDNPAVLYADTGHKVNCACDTSLESRDRIVCLVDDVKCNNSDVCHQETDIWLFGKSTGHLSARATCLFCANDDTNCASFDDTCFYSEFDADNDVSACVLVQTESNERCESCQPCIEDGTWGLSFDCFNGQWDTDGSCITGNRLGLNPFESNGNIGTPAPTPVPSPEPTNIDDCEAEIENLINCIDSSCAACLTDAYDGVFEDSTTVSCAIFENEMCSAIYSDCTSCNSCTEQAEAYYQCFALTNGCSFFSCGVSTTPAPTTLSSALTQSPEPASTKSPEPFPPTQPPVEGCNGNAIVVTLQTSTVPILFCCDNGAGEFESDGSSFEFEGCLPVTL